MSFVYCLYVQCPVSDCPLSGVQYLTVHRPLSLSLSLSLSSILLSTVMCPVSDCPVSSVQCLTSDCPMSCVQCLTVYCPMCPTAPLGTTEGRQPSTQPQSGGSIRRRSGSTAENQLEKQVRREPDSPSPPSSPSP